MIWARRSRKWAGTVLAWFVLALGVAGAAPLLQAPATQVVCSADGQLRILVTSADGWGAPDSPHALHCPLCLLGTGAAPASPPPSVGPAAAQAAPHVTRVLAATPLRNRSGAPLPARGPPVIS